MPTTDEEAREAVVSLISDLVKPYAEPLAKAFTAGVEWERNRPISDEEVEAAARVLYGYYDSEFDAGRLSWHDFEGEARAALTAARGTKQ